MGRYYQRSHGRSLDSNNSNADAWQQSSTARVGRVRGGSEPHSATVFTKLSLINCKPRMRGKTAMLLKGRQSSSLLGIVMTLALAFALPARAQSNSSSGEEKKADAGAVVTPDAGKSSVRPKGSDDPALVGFTIGEQDVLGIDVWQEKELSGPAVVRPDGKITMPLVGEIYVVGMTPVQLQGELTKRLEPFVTAPQVSVSVHEINSRKVYVMGQVAHEGVFRINSTTTVSQILVQAGRLREYAKRSKVYVLRNINGKQVRLPV